MYELRHKSLNVCCFEAFEGSALEMQWFPGAGWDVSCTSGIPVVVKRTLVV